MTDPNPNYRDFISGDTFSGQIISRSNAVANSLRQHLHSVAGRFGSPSGIRRSILAMSSRSYAVNDLAPPDS